MVVLALTRAVVALLDLQVHKLNKLHTFLTIKSLFAFHSRSKLRNTNK